MTRRGDPCVYPEILARVLPATGLQERRTADAYRRFRRSSSGPLVGVEVRNQTLTKIRDDTAPRDPTATLSKGWPKWNSGLWRSGRESNPHTRICSPLHHHSATGPSLAGRRYIGCYPFPVKCAESDDFSHRVRHKPATCFDGSQSASEMTPAGISEHAAAVLRVIGGRRISGVEAFSFPPHSTAIIDHARRPVRRSTQPDGGQPDPAQPCN